MPTDNVTSVIALQQKESQDFSITRQSSLTNDVVRKPDHGAIAVSQGDEDCSCQQVLKTKDKMIEELQARVANMEQEMELKRDEICSLRAEVKSYYEELATLNSKFEELKKKSRSSLLTDIGKEVRMRYLENHRRKMRGSLGRADYSHIKSGDRAAHRGRPLVDAYLYETHQRSDPEVYKDLYGIPPTTMQRWKSVEEIVKICGFRASLRSEDRLSSRFQDLFDELLRIAESYSSPAELRAALEGEKMLQQKLAGLEVCYDEIDKANPLRLPSR